MSAPRAGRARATAARERGSVKVWLLSFVLLAGGGMALLVGVGCAIGANACPFKEKPRQTSTDGSQLFAANCAVCHGRAGEGSTGPSLVSGRIGAYSGSTLEAKIARGKPLAGMPRFKTELTAQQIAAVARFVESLRGTPAPSGTPS